MQFILPDTYLDSIPNSIGVLYDREDGKEISNEEYQELIEKYDVPIDYSEDYNVFNKPDTKEHIIIISK